MEARALAPDLDDNLGISVVAADGGGGGAPLEPRWWWGQGHTGAVKLGLAMVEGGGRGNVDIAGVGRGEQVAGERMQRMERGHEAR